MTTLEAIQQDKLQLEYEQEYTTRIFIWTTDFKNNFYISDFVGGFSNQKFVGTEKQYDEATATYFRGHDRGKIIGYNKYTPEEWDAKHKMPELEEIKKEYTELDKYFDDIFEAKKPQREKLRRRRELE